MIVRTVLACALLIGLGSEVAQAITPSKADRGTRAATNVDEASSAPQTDMTVGVGIEVRNAARPDTDRDPACGPGAGDCYLEHGTPGCEDVDCCETVCAIDPWCCDHAWDRFCVDKAVAHCGASDPTGACCFYESCRELTENDCTGAGGEFQGLEVDCNDTTCSGGAATPQCASTDAGTIYLGAIAGQDWGRPLATWTVMGTTTSSLQRQNR